MKRIGILTAGGDTPALNAAIHGAVARANQLRIEVFGLIKGFNCLFNPQGPARSSQSAVPRDSGTRSDERRHPHRLVARLCRSDEEGRARSDYVAAAEARHRRPDRCRRRRHAQRSAAAHGTIAHGARAEDDRQRPRPELPERARRVEPRPRSALAQVSLQASRDQRRLRPRSHRQLRHAGLCHRRLRDGTRRRAHPHHRRKPSPDRDHRGHGPSFGLHRPRHRLRPARHHPGSGVSAGPERSSSIASASSTTCRRTSSSSAARASSTIRASSSATSRNRPIRPATSS